MSADIQKNKIIAFHTAAPDDEILKAGSYIFSTNARIRDEAIQAATHAFKNKKAKKAAVIYIETSFSLSYAKHFRKTFTELGGEVTSYSSSRIAERDLRPLLLKLHHSSREEC